MGTMTDVNEVATFDILDEKGPSDMFAHLYNDIASSDFKLIVENVEIHAHKAFLMARSSYFKSLFSCRMRESRENRVELQETPFEAFELLIKYIYTGKMQIPVNQIQLLLSVTEQANKYNFPEVTNKITNFLKDNITSDYACEILDTSSMCNLDELKNECLDFIDFNTTECINKESFLNISFNTLREILGRDSLNVEEVDLVNATRLWIEANQPKASKIVEIFEHIHLSSISVAEYSSLLVALLAYFTNENLAEFVKEQKNVQNSGTQYHRYRAIKNVATVEKGAQVIEGSCRPKSLSASEVLFNGEIKLDRYVYHNKSITIQLGRPYFLESLGFLLDNACVNDCYSFDIEVSKDQNTWEKLGQYEELKGWQIVRFPGQIAQYIRFVCTSLDSGGIALKYFECPAQQKTIEEAAKNV